MNGDRFDALLVSLTHRQSRRAALQRLGVAAAAGAFVRATGSSPAQAAPARQIACFSYPWQECDGVCVHIETDAGHCGGCGFACEPGDACRAGSCSRCGGTLSLCGDVCVDLQGDPANCGWCGARCQNWETCVSGACFSEAVPPPPPPGCPPGLTECSGMCVDTQHDDENCGACRVRCQPLVMECRDARCVVVEDPCFPHVC